MVWCETMISEQTTAEKECFIYFNLKHYGSGWIHSVLIEEFVDLSLAVVQTFAFA